MPIVNRTDLSPSAMKFFGPSSETEEKHSASDESHAEEPAAEPSKAGKHLVHSSNGLSEGTIAGIAFSVTRILFTTGFTKPYPGSNFIHHTIEQKYQAAGIDQILGVTVHGKNFTTPIDYVLCISHILRKTMAYFFLAATAAAAESAYLAENGQTEFQWMKVCFSYMKSCHQIGEGLVNTFLVSLSLAIVSGMSAYHLFRLYGTKGKSIQ